MKGDDSTHHSGLQIHPPHQVLEARVVAELSQRIDRLSRWVFPIAFVAIFGFVFLI